MTQLQQRIERAVIKAEQENVRLAQRMHYPFRPERTCLLCGSLFLEESLPPWDVAEILGNQVDFCLCCISRTCYNTTGNNSCSKAQILSYICDLTKVLDRIPPHQGFGERRYDLRGLNPQERLALLKVLERRPTVRRVKVIFGSWFRALVVAGVLDGGAQQMGRGIRCLAKDGHVCLSLGEKMIDDALFALGIPHKKEPAYPEGNFRADFDVFGVFIEYFGLTGNAAYDTKTNEKQKLLARHGVRLVSIFPKDLVDPRRLNTLLEEVRNNPLKTNQI